MAVDVANLGISVKSDGVVTATKRLDKLEKQSGKTEDSAKSFRRSLGDIEAEMSGPLARAQLKYNRQMEEAERLAKSGKISQSELTRAGMLYRQQLDDTTRSISGMAAKAERASKVMRDLGGTLTTRVSLPLAAIAAASVKMATDFESSFANVRKTVNASEAEFAQMSAEIRQLAKEVPTSVNELNNLAGVAGQLGVQRQNIVSFTKTIAMLGDTTDIAGEQAALSLSRFMNVMGTAQGDIDRVGATIVGLGNNFAAMESEIVAIGTSLASFGSQLNLSESDVLAFATAIAASGGHAEAASTAFQKTAMTMQRAVLEGNEDLQLFANVAGTSAEQFAASFRESASGALLQFLQGLKNVSGQGQSTASVLEELGLADQRLQREFGKVTGNLDQLRDALGVANDEWERNTALTDEAQKRYETFASQLGIFWNRLKDVAITFGNDLIPVLKSGIESAEGFLDALEDMTPETRRMIVAVSALAAAIGPLLIVLGSLVGALAKLRPLVVFLAGAGGLAALTGLLGGLATAAGVFIGYKLQETFKEAAFGAKSLKDELRDLTPEMDRFTGSVARAREEELMARLDQEQMRLAEMERRLSESSGTGMAGDIALEAKMQQQIQLVQQLSEELRINSDRWDAHNQRVIEADNGIGSWGSAMKSAIDMAREAQGNIEELGEAAEVASEKLESISSWAERVSDSMRTSKITEYRDAMIGIAESLFSAATGMQFFNNASRQTSSGGQGFFPDFGVLGSALDGMKDIRKEIEKAAAVEWSFENLIDSFHPLSQAMRQLGDDIELVNARIETGQMSQMEGMFMKTGMAANAAFGAIMSGMDRSSKEYRQMEVAQQAVNVAMGIAAILQQGMGDPYTAIPRMIAMAAMVASLVDGIGGLSGGGGGAQAAQERQGTGTVLGDPEAKSESIANAVEITADATEKLVGINRGMLHALQEMQRGLSEAAGMVARGAGQFDASGVKLDLSALSSFHSSVWDPLGFFGGSAVKDQGIALIGGAISDMTEGAVGQAFADVKKWNLFSSSKKTVTEDLSEEFNDQLNLIFDSMIDTVKSAGEALGIPLAELESRIDSFEVAAQEISLKDLSAEEQQAELEAVFSAIFDDFASHVIPFIDQFQKIGEGMGETLVRVATSVQVTQEAIRRLGLNISDSLGPERMAQVSVGLVEASGGIEQFITDMENFMGKFAPESHKFAVAQSDITRALEQMNFALPATRDGFWNLIQTIDGTTEAGQRQIATLLGLTDAADTYYSAVEDIESERQGLLERMLELRGREGTLRQLELEALDSSNRLLQERIWALEDEAELAGIMSDVSDEMADMMSPATAELSRMMATYDDMIDRARELGASEQQLLQIRRLQAAQLDRWIAEARLSALRLAEDFFSAGDSFEQTTQTVSQSIDNMRDTALRALGSIDEWLMSSQLDNLSPLTPNQQLNESESQFMSAFEAAMGGDFEALQNLPNLADAFLGQAATFYGTSTDQYNQIWQMVQDMMNQAADIDPPPEQQPPNAGQIDTLIDTNSQFSTAIEALEQEIAAQELGSKLAAIALASESTPFQIAQELGFTNQNMRQLLGALGHDIPMGTEAELRTYFNDVIGGLAQDSDLVNSIDQLNSTIGSLHAMIKYNLIDIAGLIGDSPILYPPDDDDPPIMEGTTNYPRNSYGTSGDFTEIRQELNRIGGLLERGNTDRRDGLGAVVDEERATRRHMKSDRTVRAV